MPKTKVKPKQSQTSSSEESHDDKLSLAEEEETQQVRLPRRVLLDIETASIVVPQAEFIKLDAARMKKNINQVGLIEPPSLEQIFEENEVGGGKIYYRVVVGRRRTLACQQLAAEGIPYWQSIQALVYEEPVPNALRHLAVLGENLARSDNWLAQLEAVSDLVAHGIGMSERDLSRQYGLNAAKLSFYLSLAKLPPRLLSEILTGDYHQATARKLLGLSRGRQEELAALLDEGMTLTDDLIERSRKVTLAQRIEPMFEEVAGYPPEDMPQNDNAGAMAGKSSPEMEETKKGTPEISEALRQSQTVLEVLPKLRRYYPSLGMVITLFQQQLEQAMKVKKGQ